MEISNKTLAILLVIAIVLAVGGALLSLGRTGITGLGSGTGYVNVTVSQDTSISVSHPDIDFGSGNIEGTNETAQLISNGTTINWSSAQATPHSITINNGGNVNITVTVSAERNSTSFFLNQTGTKEYKYKTENNESGSAQSLVTTLTDLNTTTQTICTHLSSASANTINLVASLQFGTTIQGTFTDTLTFSSSAT